ncbi:hypothetical protein A3C87_04225 [Candidatus Kaiserbacteria bacterium RIFCSPHIGHO2_02_FULL_49_34]|uniref:Uncharacterized protein n=1 Tax=Candidatus Kaiserbacteria bacterium RIFCSPHIGHO2_02_FULL_49_34 TaxID=1798491 RepID=A0A1F6DJR3_9BACT|nr:MAG: hypothetical protein A3C87_04225 [Candidatus Kaiserbacteria bacterium RIFCSPHIGHO2_02_FULL_49_34]
MKKLYRSLLVFVFALCGVTSAYADENIAVAAGSAHTLFLKHDGTVWAAGYNGNGQLGDGSLWKRPNPVKVAGLNNVVSIAASGQHSLFLKGDGTVWVTGLNNNGQLGIGTLENKSIAVQIPNLSSVVELAASGDSSAFLKSDGTVWITGKICGQFGMNQCGTPLILSSPTQITNAPNDVTAISLAGDFGLYLKNDGTVWAAGQWGVVFSTNPVQVNNVSDIIEIYGSFFLEKDGSVWATGNNTYGQLGDGTTVSVSRNEPIKITTISDVKEISAMSTHSLFLKNDGTVWAAGYNGYGQLGDGTTVNRSVPVAVIGAKNALMLASMNYQSFYVREGGLVHGVGNNTFGKLGIGYESTSEVTPVAVVKGASVDTCNDTYLHLLPCGTIINATLQKVYQGGILTTREQIAVNVKVFDKSIKPIPPATQYGDVYLNEQAALVASCSAGTPCPVLAEGDYYVIAEYYDESGAASYRMKPVTFSEGSMGVASLLFVSHYDSSYNLLWTH